MVRNRGSDDRGWLFTIYDYDANVLAVLKRSLDFLKCHSGWARAPLTNIALTREVGTFNFTRGPTARLPPTSPAYAAGQAGHQGCPTLGACPDAWRWACPVAALRCRSRSRIEPAAQPFRVQGLWFGNEFKPFALLNCLTCSTALPIITNGSHHQIYREMRNESKNTGMASRRQGRLCRLLRI